MKHLNLFRPKGLALVALASLFVGGCTAEEAYNSRTARYGAPIYRVAQVGFNPDEGINSRRPDLAAREVYAQPRTRYAVPRSQPRYLVEEEAPRARRAPAAARTAAAPVGQPAAAGGYNPAGGSLSGGGNSGGGNGGGGGGW